jgi:UDP-glucose 4-epimerase
VKVFVTGGAGFIGHHTVRALVQAGHEVLVADNLSTGRREHLPPGTPLAVLDILDQPALEAAMQDFRPHWVLHLAARVSIRASVTDFTEDARQNFIGTSQVLEAAIKANSRRLVFASSMAVYADAPDPRPLPEDWPPEPLSPYGISKHASEQLLHLMGRRAGLTTMALRFFNTFGTGQTLTPYVGVITIFVNQILAGKPPVIFGDGRQCRDFVYVGDVARACVLALESSLTGLSLNIGTGRGTTVNDLAALLLSRLKSALTPEYAAVRPEELRNSVAATTQARTLLCFAAEFGLKDKIDEVIAALRKT